MGRVSESLDERHVRFIESQRLFFVATAPLDPAGHVNLSPKGFDSFRILDPRTVAYLDLTGSGIETVAHLRQNGRICLMFCAFEGPPKILRLHGRGEVVEAAEPGYDALAERFPRLEAARSVIRVRLTRVAESCGFGVPLYQYQGEREHYAQFARSLSPEKFLALKGSLNARSLDGLPGLAPAAPPPVQEAG